MAPGSGLYRLPQEFNIRALIIRIGFWGIRNPPKNSIGNYLSPYSKRP